MHQKLKQRSYLSTFYNPVQELLVLSPRHTLAGVMPVCVLSVCVCLVCVVVCVCPWTQHQTLASAVLVCQSLTGGRCSEGVEGKG